MWIRFVFGLAAAAALIAPSTGLAAADDHGPKSGAATAAPVKAPQPPAHDEEGHGGAKINPLDFQADLAIWTAVVFLVLMAILWKFAWGPIADGLDKRERRIADQIAAAEQANSEARQMLVEYQGKLAGSEAEVREILDRGRREAEELGRQMLDKTRQDAQRERQRALREIDAATADALKELAARSADLAIELAGKIIQVKVDRAEHARLVEQAVAGFAKIEPGKN